MGSVDVGPGLDRGSDLFPVGSTDLVLETGVDLGTPGAEVISLMSASVRLSLGRLLTWRARQLLTLALGELEGPELVLDLEELEVAEELEVVDVAAVDLLWLVAVVEVGASDFVVEVLAAEVLVVDG